jgi:lambda family phage portal protein
VLLRLRELDALTDAQLVRQKIGALLAGFVTDADGTSLEGAHDGGNVASLEPGTMQRLKPGESVTFSDPPQTDAGAEAFQRGIVREIGAGIGIPSFMLDNDMGEVNFSSARVALIAFRRRLEQWQDSFAHQFLRPVYRRWLTIEILSGRIEAELNEQTLRCKFIPARSAWVDPLKDSQSTVIALGAGLTSRREAVAALGLNIEELDAEIAADQAREKALGISFAPLPPVPPAGEEDEPPAGAPPRAQHNGKANGHAAQ